jgi:hypothetical protein
MLNVVVLSVAFYNCYNECHYAECHCAVRAFLKKSYITKIKIIIIYVMKLFSLLLMGEQNKLVCLSLAIFFRLA